MKVAIPSNDNINISAHFGRSKGFVICEIDNGQVTKREYIQNSFTGHAQGSHHHHEHGHSHEHGHEHQHSHAGIFKAIGDCETVIAGGMGRRLYDDFMQKNIKVYVTREMNIDNAIALFINSELDNNSETCCQH